MAPGNSPLDMHGKQTLSTNSTARITDAIPFYDVRACVQNDGFFTEDGKPKARCPSNWRGPNGLYCVGFSGRGLLGAGADALRAAADIAGSWQEEETVAAGAEAATISPV